MSDAIELTLQFGIGEDADQEELETATFRILQEMRELDFVESVSRAPGVLEPGAKGDPITVGALAVVILPALLPKLLDFIQAWVTAKQGRTAKFKGTIGGQIFEYEGTREDFVKLLTILSNGSQGQDRIISMPA